MLINVGSLPKGSQFRTALTKRYGTIQQLSMGYGALNPPVVLLDPLQPGGSFETKVLHPSVRVEVQG